MEEKRRTFYSVPVKTVVMILCALGFFLVGFCGILLMDLAVRGVPLSRQKTAYENTETCGMRMVEYLQEIQRFYENQYKLNIGRGGSTEDGETQEEGVDLVTFGNGAVGDAGDNTFYTLAQLDAIAGSVLSMNNDYILPSSEEFATNDAGVEVYQAEDYDTYESYDEYESTAETTDIYQKAR